MLLCCERNSYKGCCHFFTANMELTSSLHATARCCGRNANSNQPIALVKLPVSGACCKLDGTPRRDTRPNGKGAVQAVKTRQQQP